MSEQLISFDDSPDDIISPTGNKNIVDDLDPFRVTKQGDLLFEIETEMQNGSSYNIGDDSGLTLDFTVNTSSDINSLVESNDDATDVMSTNNHSDQQHTIDTYTNGEIGGRLDDDGDLHKSDDEVHDNGGVYENDDEIHDNGGVYKNVDEIHDNGGVYKNDDDVHKKYEAYKNDDEVHEKAEIPQNDDQVQEKCEMYQNDDQVHEKREMSPQNDDEVHEHETVVHDTYQIDVNMDNNNEMPVNDSMPIWDDSVNGHVDVDERPVRTKTSISSDSEADMESEPTELVSIAQSAETTHPDTQTFTESTEIYQESHENYFDATENNTNTTENIQDNTEYYQEQDSKHNEPTEVPIPAVRKSSTDKVPLPSARQTAAMYRDGRTVSEDDMTKSPSDSECEEEEVIENGEVVYRTSDEDHTTELVRDIPKYRDDIITGNEPGDIGDRMVVFEDYERTHKTTKEEVTPGKIRSPFIEGGLEANRNDIAKDQVHFAEMANVRNRFESGQSNEPDARGPRSITPPRDFEKGEYTSNENSPRDPNIVRAEDRVSEEEYLPKVGASLQMKARLKEASTQNRDYKPKKSVQEDIGKVDQIEYESQPEPFEQWQNKTEGGIYENEPDYNPDVVREQDRNIGAELPEVGYTKNLLQKFKNIQSDENYQSKPIRRELTPPISDRIEYSSEPTPGIQLQEQKVEAGIFESQPEIREDVVHSNEGEVIVAPEQGYAKNVAKMFRQMSETKGDAVPKPKKEFTPPRDDLLRSPVLESTPTESEAVRESDQVDNIVPSQGATRNIAMRFQQMNSEPAHRGSNEGRQITLTAGGDAGIYENTPDVNEEVVHSGDVLDERLPEQGNARNLVAQFRQMERTSGTQSQDPRQSSRSPRSPHTQYKEFTPPREEPRIEEQRMIGRLRSSSGGVTPEDMPDQFVAQSGGVFESSPDYREDVSREGDTDINEGLPTPESTKNLVARFKNIQKTAQVQSQTPKPIVRKVR